MFHINDNDDVKPCKAKQPSNCKFYKDEDDTRHYSSVSEAQSFIEEKLAKEHGITDKKVRYSFVKEFKKQEEKFNQDFDGIPNRFFNTDLRGKFADASRTEEELKLRYMNISGLGTRLLTSLSAPSDNKINDEQVSTLLSEQGFNNVQEINDNKLLKGFKSDRAWKATIEDQEVIIIDGNAGNEINRYAFRTGNDHFKAYSYWTKIDLRKVAGNARAERKTGINILKTIMKTESVEEQDKQFKINNQAIVDAIQNSDEISEELRNEITLAAKRSDYRRNVIADAVLKLEDAQSEGKNFIAQKKYIRDADNPAVATVWQEKKDTDDVRKDLIKNSKLNNYFKKLDLDNDVDPAEFASFEKDYLEIADKLPKFPKGMEPSLHIRKTGKHSGGNFHVHGLFNPNRNAVAIDIRTGKSSTVHELYHHYDLITKNNISLSPEFQNLSKTYDDNLKMPAGLEGKEYYYKTKTEQFSRFCEVWMNEKQGVTNSLIDASKFDRFDYAPLQNNPEFKKRVFDFLDKIHEES